MDNAQIKNQLAALGRGGIYFAAGVAVGRGWLNNETALTIAGAVLTAIGTGWSAVANTNTSIVSAASQVPQVASMTLTDPQLASAAKKADPATEIKVV